MGVNSCYIIQCRLNVKDSMVYFLAEHYGVPFESVVFHRVNVGNPMNLGGGTYFKVHMLFRSTFTSFGA